MTQPAMPPPESPVHDRPVVASYRTYAQAQRAVDFLSDHKFPVQRAAIVGGDLRLVETVLGRLTRGRAALAGAGSGAWFGLLVGLLLAVFTSGHSMLLMVLSGVGYGAAFGAVFGFAAHAATGGRRDFTSRSAIMAARYDIVTDPAVADDARNLLIKLSWREG